LNVKVTSNPSGALPGEVVGRPIRLPAVLLCTNGERFCGKTWTANSQWQLTAAMKERRAHEQSCRGGLIVVGSS